MNNKNSLFLLLISLLFITFALAACNTEESNSANESNSSSSNKNEETIDGEGNATEEDLGETVLLNMGTMPTGTSWYLYMSESANVMNNNVNNLNISLQETGGTRSNAIELANETIDVGFIEAFVADESYHGIGRFEGEGNEDLRIFSYVAQSSMHWAVTQESGITSFEELNGEEFNPSSVGGGGEYITEKVFNVIGVEPDYQRMTLEDAADMVRNGQLIGFSYNGVPPIPTFTEVHSSQPLRVLSLTDEQVAAVEEELPFLSSSIIPEDAYPGSPEAQTIGVYMGMGMNKSLDTDIVYDMAKAYYENLDKIGEVFPLAADSTPEDTIENSTVPLHAGVVKYFEEIGIDVPNELIPDEYTEE